MRRHGLELGLVTATSHHPVPVGPCRAETITPVEKNVEGHLGARCRLQRSEPVSKLWPREQAKSMAQGQGRPEAAAAQLIAIANGSDACRHAEDQPRHVGVVRGRQYRTRASRAEPRRAKSGRCYRPSKRSFQAFGAGAAGVSIHRRARLEQLSGVRSGRTFRAIQPRAGLEVPAPRLRRAAAASMRSADGPRWRRSSGAAAATACLGWRSSSQNS